MKYIEYRIVLKISLLSNKHDNIYNSTFPPQGMGKRKVRPRRPIEPSPKGSTTGRAGKVSANTSASLNWIAPLIGAASFLYVASVPIQDSHRYFPDYHEDIIYSHPTIGTVQPEISFVAAVRDEKKRIPYIKSAVSRVPEVFSAIAAGALEGIYYNPSPHELEGVLKRVHALIAPKNEEGYEINFSDFHQEMK